MADSLTTKRYSDTDLEEFRILIDEKIAQAREDFRMLQSELQDFSENNDDETKWDPEAGSDHTTKEYLAQQISRKVSFIKNLENALMRISNKTYGVCRETGELISKDRLRIVPHATLSVEAKNRRAQT